MALCLPSPVPRLPKAATRLDGSSGEVAMVEGESGVGLPLPHSNELCACDDTVKLLSPGERSGERRSSEPPAAWGTRLWALVRGRGHDEPVLELAILEALTSCRR